MEKSNPSAPPAPACRPGCAQACVLVSWGWVVDDRLPSPPAWRIAWCLLGLPDPLPTSEYPAFFEAVEAAYGVAIVIRGLRKAAGISPHGSGVDPDELAALARRYEAAGR